MSSAFDLKSSFTRVKVTAENLGLRQTLLALYFCRKCHQNQTRKDGDPYIIHPVMMACNALSMGIYDDILLAALLLHDVKEDCDIEFTHFPTSDEVNEIVGLLTFRQKTGQTKQEALQQYYAGIASNVRAIIIKLIDRCHNVSTMAEVFKKEKIEEYIEETRKYVLPLYKIAREQHPEYSSTLFVLKYHIVSVIQSISFILNRFGQ